MSKVSPELDNMLWSVAESNDPIAIEEFGNRYPTLKSELISRIHMVRTFKGARPDRTPPHLTLTTSKVERGISTRIAVGLGAVAFASLAFAVVLAVQPKNTAKPLPVQQQITVDHNQPITDQKEENPTGTQGKEVPGSVTPQDPPKFQESPPTAFEKLVNIDVSQGYLAAIIRDIGQQSGLSVEFAPGFENQMISARYQGISSKQALDDLGQNFGFTAVQEGEKAILIVPTVDQSKPVVPTPPGSFSEPAGNQEDERDSAKSPTISKN